MTSPPLSPGSPLTYSPQVAMEPIPKHGADDGSVGAGRTATEFVGAAGWPAQPKLVPVVIACEAIWPPLHAGNP
jgi:5'-AMP-activated protein kinase, regulatory beta subunit